MHSVTNIQKYSIHDGDGIRTTVFFKGCHLRCQWCHNPETISAKPELMFYANKCIGCGVCTTKCDFDAIHLSREHPECSTMYKNEDKLKAIIPYAAKRRVKILKKKLKKR